MKTPRELILEKHRGIESKLAQIRPEELAALAQAEAAHAACPVRPEMGLWATVRAFWQEAIWPWRRAWLGMAALWLVMLLAFAATDDAPRMARSKSRPPSPEVLAVLREQKQLMSQLCEPAASARPAEPRLPGRRSEIRTIVYLT